MCTDSLKSFWKTDNVAGTPINNLMVGALMGLDWMDWTCGNFQYSDFLESRVKKHKNAMSESSRVM